MIVACLRWWFWGRKHGSPSRACTYIDFEVASLRNLPYSVKEEKVLWEMTTFAEQVASNMETNALSVANYFVEISKREGKDLRLLGLVKRVYIAHGFSLANDY